MIFISLIYSRVTSYLHCFDVNVFAPYVFYLSYTYIIDRFLTEVIFGSEALIKVWPIF